MRRLFLILAILTLSVTGAFSQTSNNKIGGADQSKLAKAIDDYDHGHYRQSAEQLRKLAEKYPSNPDIYYYLGLNSVKRNFNTTGIRRYFTKVIQLSPDYPEAAAHFYMGLIHYTDNDFEQAEADFNRFFERANNHGTPSSDALYEEASVYLYWTSFLAEAYRHPVPFTTHIVRPLSSPEDEILPYFTPDGRNCFFLRNTVERSRTSYYHSSTEKKRLKIFSSTLTDSTFSSPTPLPSPFNQGDPEGSVCLTADGHELFYSIIRRVHGYNNSDIYVVHFNDGKWGPAQNLGDQVNTPDTWESQPSITPDGKWLYFASNRPGGMGGTDIWRCQRLSDGSWSNPVNMGPKVNTSRNEKCPFIHADGHTLYFSSDGRQGLGGYDLYFINLTDTSAKSPTNMGHPINTENDEISFGVTADGRQAYFAGTPKQDGMGGTDIIQFDLYPAARPESMRFCSGKITDSHGNPIEATITIRHGSTTPAVYTTSSDGIYSILLSSEHTNTLNITSPGFSPATLSVAPTASVPHIINLRK